MKPSDMNAMLWFNETFGVDIKVAVKGTAFSPALILAISMQETSYLWRGLYKKKTVEQVLSLCVGDTIDEPSRTAFPRSRSSLEAWPKGKEMFKVARAALGDVAEIDKTYAKMYAIPDKFCHGFGMFQYDLQYFKVDPEFFLKRKWATFAGTLGKCMGELQEKLKTVYGAGKKTLTHDESVYVAIAYNKGSVDFKKKFKQGHENADGKFYGELLDAYLTYAETLKL